MPKIFDDSTGPIGAIVSSLLTETQYQSLYGTGWVLMDGRSCVGSAYAAVTGAATIPDARGMLLRGKNNGRSDGNQNPAADRNLGDFEGDQMQGHYHTDSPHSHYQGVQSAIIENNYASINSASNGNASGSQSGVGYTKILTQNSSAIVTSPSSDGTNGTPRTGLETRTKNITVNHFIRIN
jgi:hypothetical protein